MGIYAAGVVVLSFICFVLVAEQINPFFKPVSHVKRIQWRYGRRVSVAALVAGAIFLALIQWTQVATLVALASCFALFCVAWIVIARRAKFGRLY